LSGIYLHASIALLIQTDYCLRNFLQCTRLVGGEGGIGCGTSLCLASLMRDRFALQIVCPDDLSNLGFRIKSSHHLMKP